MSKATIIIRGNAIFDGTGTEPFAGSVVINGNQIAAVLRENDAREYIGEETKVFDCGDQLIMPGFNDSHTHITAGAFLEDEDFSFCVLEAASKEAAIQMARDYAAVHPNNEWIYGFMMNNLIWEDQTLPVMADIDKLISDRPVILQMADLHTIILNSAAMKKVDITKDTPNPEDGIIEKYDNGELTGRLYDGASFKVMDMIYSPSDEVYISVYTKFFQKMRSLGITTVSLLSPYTVHDDPIPYFEEMDKQGNLTTRVIMYPNISTYEKESFAALRKNYSSGKLRVMGLKQLIDGVTGVYTAALLEPYTNKPDTCGTYSVDIDEFRNQALNVIKDGVPLRVHTIGDKAVRVMLDIFEEGERLYGKQGLRHVQEHLETVQPVDQPRFAQLGVVGSMSPTAMLFDLEGGEKGNGLYGDKEAAVGAERAAISWPLRSLIDQGMILAMNSDFPVVGIEPFTEIYGAVTRQTYNGLPEGGWYPQQRITVAEALKAYTWGSAYCEGCENDFGTLAQGMLADVIVLDRNLFEVEPKEILDTNVTLTVMDGEVVYEK
jgi:predicted amidohydrolase YtcJ